MGKQMMREDDELKNESLGEEVISPQEGILIQGKVFRRSGKQLTIELSLVPTDVARERGESNTLKGEETVESTAGCGKLEHGRYIGQAEAGEPFRRSRRVISYYTCHSRCPGYGITTTQPSGHQPHRNHLSSCCCGTKKTISACANATVLKAPPPEAHRQHFNISSSSPRQPLEFQPTLAFRYPAYNTALMLPYTYNTRPLKNPQSTNNYSPAHLSLQHPLQTRIPCRSPPWLLISIISCNSTFFLFLHIVPSQMYNNVCGLEFLPTFGIISFHQVLAEIHWEAYINVECTLFIFICALVSFPSEERCFKHLESSTAGWNDMNKNVQNKNSIMKKMLLTFGIISFHPVIYTRAHINRPGETTPNNWSSNSQYPVDVHFGSWHSKSCVLFGSQHTNYGIFAYKKNYFTMISSPNSLKIWGGVALCWNKLLLFQMCELTMYPELNCKKNLCPQKIYKFNHRGFTCVFGQIPTLQSSVADMTFQSVPQRA
ncbi:hypothetical protein VP01_120g3 [Puccinia sorghi]|uniref:Uncharacterized protein n=1 Tax=Puccinia sorghi TaxID=27349 RepID=A0A0L6VQG5_9BASI|nr:hypothetical protein VP01_120g3 [Puccinia sorghi]